MKQNCQLRYAAGLYWLLQMDQSGKEDVHPIPMNEGGASIWKMYQQGNTKEQIALQLCEQYGIGQEEAAADIMGFFEELKKQGIME